MEIGTQHRCCSTHCIYILYASWTNRYTVQCTYLYIYIYTHIQRDTCQEWKVAHSWNFTALPVKPRIEMHAVESPIISPARLAWERFQKMPIDLSMRVPIGSARVYFNPLMPNRYNCTYVLFLFLRSNWCKKLIRTLLTHKSPKHTIMSIEINHFHNSIHSQFKVKLAIFIFGTNGLTGAPRCSGGNYFCGSLFSFVPKSSWLLFRSQKFSAKVVRNAPMLHGRAEYVAIQKSYLKMHLVTQNSLADLLRFKR